jgi:hypothetical protein
MFPGMSFRHLAAPLSLLLASVACNGSDSGGGTGEVVVDSAGAFPVVTVRGDSPRWTARHLFTLGTPDSGTIEFGSVRSVLLDPSGTLVVVDSRNRRVLEFDSTGSLVRQVGRDGAGPGEYREPYSVAWLDRGLAVLDPVSPRLSVFGPGDEWHSWPVQPITGGQVVRLYRTPPAFWSMGIRPAGNTSQRLFIRWDASGPRDTIVAVDQPGDLDRGAMCEVPGGGITFFSAPFAASFLQVPTADGTRIVARTDAYRMAWLDPGGNDSTRLLVREVSPGTVSDAEWTASLADWQKHTSRFGTSGCDRTSFARKPVKPVVSWIFQDELGRLWVEALTSNGTRYDLYDPAGLPIATITGLDPSGGIDPSATRDRIALAGEDASGVPVVRVYRIER